MSGVAGSGRAQVFKARSIREVLAVMPSRDLRFTGLTFGWVGVGFIRAVKKEGMSDV